MALLLLLALSNAVKINGEESDGQCDYKLTLDPRPHSVSILEFGAVGDGKTLNTIAFRNAIFYLKSFADKGGAQLYVPPGRWLTGSFNLTSHLTLFLEKGAVILGSQVLIYAPCVFSTFLFVSSFFWLLHWCEDMVQEILLTTSVIFVSLGFSHTLSFVKDPSHWEVADPLPSYGRGIDLPGGRYRSLINGYMLQDVVITGICNFKFLLLLKCYSIDCYTNAN